MISGVLLMTGILSAVVFVLLLVFRRDLIGVDLSARSLVRLYLYLASLAAVIVLAIGVSALLDWGAARAFGSEPVYGRPPLETVCAVGEKCPDPAQLAQQYLHEREQQQDHDLIRGATFTLFGLVFWGAHRLARRFAGAAEELTSALRRSYLTLGTFVFGLATIVLVPVGMYLALSVALLTPKPDVFIEGVAGSLSGGIMTLPIWLAYLFRLVRDFRALGEPVSVGRTHAAARVPA